MSVRQASFWNSTTQTSKKRKCKQRSKNGCLQKEKKPEILEIK
jgi:hypothetical protein